MKRSVKFVAFGCTHFPFQDRQAIEDLYKFVREVRPDVVVHLGDGHEADAATRWPSEAEHDLPEEYRQHNAFLQDLRLLVPRARKVLMWGNHDDHLIAEHRVLKKLRGLVNPRLHEPELAKWEQFPYVYDRTRGVFRLGQVTFAHGYEVGTTSGETHTLLLGVPYGLYVGAHTHRPEPVTQAMRSKTIPLPYWHANVGCLRDLKPEYVRKARTHAWGHACVVGRCDPSDTPRLKQAWSAETVVFRMYDQWQPSERISYANRGSFNDDVFPVSRGGVSVSSGRADEGRGPEGGLQLDGGGNRRQQPQGNHGGDRRARQGRRRQKRHGRPVGKRKGKRR